MWVYTKIGFFSIVRDMHSDRLMVRARVRKDLEAFQAAHAPSSPIIRTSDADYPFRLLIDRVDFEVAMASLASDIDYLNFKGVILQTAGEERFEVYSAVHDITQDIEREQTKDPRRSARRERSRHHG